MFVKMRQVIRTLAQEMDLCLTYMNLYEMATMAHSEVLSP